MMSYLLGGPVVQSSTRKTQEHARRGFKPRMERHLGARIDLTIRLRDNVLSLESLYRPACLPRTLRQIKEEKEVLLTYLSGATTTLRPWPCLRRLRNRSRLGRINNSDAVKLHNLKKALRVNVPIVVVVPIVGPFPF